jgi:hypothetical protein
MIQTTYKGHECEVLKDGRLQDILGIDIYGTIEDLPKEERDRILGEMQGKPAPVKKATAPKVERQEHPRQEGKQTKATPAKEASPERPTLHGDDTDIKHLAELAWQAIADANHPERLFLFNGVPVRLILEEDNVIIDPLDKYKLQLECAEPINWIVKHRDIFKPARPPLSVVQSMLAVEQIPLPKLKAIIPAPVFDKDGILISKPDMIKRADYITIGAICILMKFLWTLHPKMLKKPKIGSIT